MRNVLLLLLMALMWGCQERLMSPEDVVQVKDDAVFGSTALRLPGLKGLGKASKKAQCTFELTISGDKMSDMVFTFPLGDNDTMVVIDKIPAGAARQFRGVLREGKTITHEGIAEARIQAGKVAFVKLYLRAASGSAEVEVIIEDDTSGAPLEGCMKLKGEINGESLDELSIEILGMTGDEFWTYIKRNGEFAGKFWGTIADDQTFEGDFGLQTATMSYLVKGKFAADWSMFKAEVFDFNNPEKQIGRMDGFTIDCEDVPPPQTCFTDTMMITGCLSETQLMAVVLEECINNKFIPGKSGVLNSCSGSGFEGIVFDYCLPAGPLSCYSDSIVAPDGCMPEDVLMTMYLEFCIDNRAIPGSFSLLEPCTGKSGKGFSRILFDYCSEEPVQPPPPPPSSRCMAVDGVIYEDTLFKQVYLRSLDFSPSTFTYEVIRSGITVGKFYGNFDNKNYEFTGFFPIPSQEVMVKGVFSDDGIMFKGTAFDSKDTTIVVGYLDGHSLSSCDDIPQPPPPPPPASECFAVDGVILEDTLFGEVFMRKAGFTGYGFGFDLFRGGNAIGQFTGFFKNEYMEFTGFWKTDMRNAMVKGAFTPDGSDFKGTVFDIDDTTKVIGYIGGYSVDCSEIDPPEPTPPIDGCYTVLGKFGATSLEGLMMKGAGIYNGELQSYLYRDDKEAAKFYGEITGTKFKGGIYLIENDAQALVEGGFTDDFTGFEGVIIDQNDPGEIIGNIQLFKTECSEKPNPIMGCFELFGELNTYSLDGIVSYTKDFENGEFHASLARDGVYAGYMFGTANNDMIHGNMVFETDTAMIRGYFSTDGSAFKATLFNHIDTTAVIGAFGGDKISCPKELFN